MASYRGPDWRRILAQFAQLAAWHGATVTWRQYVSGSTGTGSGYYAGGGTTRYYHEQTITGLWGAPRMRENRFHEVQTPAGQVMAGDAVISTRMPLGSQDELIWRGVIYRVEGDSTPLYLGGSLWYRTLLRRGDATG